MCKECGSVNCYSWQLKCKNENKPVTFFGKCKGEPSKFGDLSKFAIPYIPKRLKEWEPKTSQNQAPAATNPRVVSPASDSEDEFSDFCAQQPVKRKIMDLPQTKLE